MGTIPYKNYRLKDVLDNVLELRQSVDKVKEIKTTRANRKHLFKLETCPSI